MLAVGLISGVLPAQQVVVHLYVDTKSGDDDLASGAGMSTTSYNPSTSTGTTWCPGTTVAPPRPHRYSLTTGEILLHVPFPFSSITGAVQYLRNNPRPLPFPPAPVPPLPVTDSSYDVTGTVQHPSVEWTYAVIHALPGIYRAPNEVFPIYLPANVSVQGTSALDTVIDCRGGDTTGPAFAFGSGPTSTGGVFEYLATGENTFVDGLRITNAGPPNDPLSDESLYCAVYVAPDVAAAPTITNCVFDNNFIAIGIAAGRDAQNPVDHDGIVLANNTFAFNRCAIYNGQTSRGQADPPPAAVGRSRIALLNNIVDASARNDAATFGCYVHRFVGAGGQGFVGIDPDDLLVDVGGGTFADTNAYEHGKVDLFAGSGYGRFGQTEIRSGPATPRPTSGFDLRDLTGGNGLGPSFPRGILFVSDLFCAARVAAGGTTGVFDVAPGFVSAFDFRLAPSVNPPRANPGAPPLFPTGLGPVLVPNPLIDRGYAATPLVFQNGITLASAPGSLPLTNQSDWAFDSWDFDTEGFGNPRVVDHVYDPNTAFPGGYPTSPFASGPVDVGADEAGELVIAGYRSGASTGTGPGPGVSFSRRSFEGAEQPGTMGTPGGSLATQNVVLWYLVPAPNPTGGAQFFTPLAEPSYRVYYNDPAILTAFSWPQTRYGGLGTWCDADDPFDLLRSPCDTGVPPGCAAIDVYPATLVEIVPQLPPDVHPWWNQTPSLSFGAGPDQFPPSNSVWQECLAPNFNTTLFMPPTAGHVHPPGGSAFLSIGAFFWLDPLILTADTPRIAGTDPVYATFNNWRAAGSGAILGGDDWCRALINDAAGVRTETVLPNTAPAPSLTTAIRFTVQLDRVQGGTPVTDTTNAQTFLIRILDHEPSQQ